MRSLLIFVIFFSVISSVQAGISGKIVLVSDYIFRGITLTDSHPGIQGGIEYNHDSGFFVGVYAKSVDFDNSDIDTRVEIDNYIGYRFKVGPINVDMRAIYFVFPGTSEFNFPEYFFGINYPTKHVTYHAFVIHSAEFLNDKGNDALYLNGGGTIHLPKGFNVKLALGHQDFKTGEAYYDYYAGVSKNLFGLDFTAAYTDISGNRNSKHVGSGNTHTFVFSIAKSF